MERFMAKDIGKKKMASKAIATKGCVKLKAGGAAKQRAGFPMTKKPVAPKKK